MKLANKLLRESSYNRQNISRNRIDYGGFYQLSYTSPNGPDKYFVFVVQPNVEGKMHCLDLERIQDDVFDLFFEEIRLDNDFEVVKRKRSLKGYVKRNIRIGPAFYKYFIKRNNRLMEDYPYKTLIFNKIQSVRYIAYDIK